MQNRHILPGGTSDLDLELETPVVSRPSNAPRAGFGAAHYSTRPAGRTLSKHDMKSSATFPATNQFAFRKLYPDDIINYLEHSAFPAGHATAEIVRQYSLSGDVVLSLMEEDLKQLTDDDTVQDTLLGLWRGPPRDRLISPQKSRFPHLREIFSGLPILTISDVQEIPQLPGFNDNEFEWAETSNDSDSDASSSATLDTPSHPFPHTSPPAVVESLPPSDDEQPSEYSEELDRGLLLSIADSSHGINTAGMEESAVLSALESLQSANPSPSSVVFSDSIAEEQDTNLPSASADAEHDSSLLMHVDLLPTAPSLETQSEHSSGSLDVSPDTIQPPAHGKAAPVDKEPETSGETGGTEEQVDPHVTSAGVVPEVSDGDHFDKAQQSIPSEGSHEQVLGSPVSCAPGITHEAASSAPDIVTEQSETSTKQGIREISDLAVADTLNVVSEELDNGTGVEFDSATAGDSRDESVNSIKDHILDVVHDPASSVSSETSQPSKASTAEPIDAMVNSVVLEAQDIVPGAPSDTTSKEVPEPSADTGGINEYATGSPITGHSDLVMENPDSKPSTASADLAGAGSLPVNQILDIVPGSPDTAPSYVSEPITTPADEAVERMISPFIAGTLDAIPEEQSPVTGDAVSEAPSSNSTNADDEHSDPEEKDGDEEIEGSSTCDHGLQEFVTEVRRDISPDAASSVRSFRGSSLSAGSSDNGQLPSPPPDLRELSVVTTLEFEHGLSPLRQSTPSRSLDVVEDSSLSGSESDRLPLLATGLSTSENEFLDSLSAAPDESLPDVEDQSSPDIAAPMHTLAATGLHYSGLGSEDEWDELSDEIRSVSSSDDDELFFGDYWEVPVLQLQPLPSSTLLDELEELSPLFRTDNFSSQNDSSPHEYVLGLPGAVFPGHKSDRPLNDEDRTLWLPVESRRRFRPSVHVHDHHQQQDAQTSSNIDSGHVKTTGFPNSPFTDVGVQQDDSAADSEVRKLRSKIRELETKLTQERIHAKLRPPDPTPAPSLLRTIFSGGFPGARTRPVTPTLDRTDAVRTDLVSDNLSQQIL